VSTQDQFLNVIDRDEAERRFHAALSLAPLGVETVPLTEALGRVLAADIVARVDVPSFDRSNFDGFAIHAEDSFGATELQPRTVALLPQTIDAGTLADMDVLPGHAVPIATGGMVPRGADAILMIEYADVENLPLPPGEGRGEGEPRKAIELNPRATPHLQIRKPVSPGHGIAFAGTDIARGETVLRIGTHLTARETGVLAAIGEHDVHVWRRPRVAIISTGNELIAPGETMSPPHVYDSNAQILADSVRELGGVPHVYGIVCDDSAALRTMLNRAIKECDVVLLSGGTSKGQGDLCYRVVAELDDPGIVAHGVALKPGKPICLAATRGKPVVILPGFPTSAIFTFHEFVAPVVEILAARLPVACAPEAGCSATHASSDIIRARMAVKVNSDVGRTEYLLVSLVHSDAGLTAYPIGKGSGSVTTFSRADGFVTIGRHTELLDAGQEVEVRPIGRGLALADLVVIGSHCVGLDYLLSKLQQRGITSKLITVGSSAGLEAVRRNECDLAGIHLLDADTGEYNRPFLSAEMTLVPGYIRTQGIVHRKDDPRFKGKSLDEIVLLLRSPSPSRGGAAPELAQPSMINRNQGSGTRILIDRLLAGARPAGYAIQATNHNAIAAAIAQNRADWGLAIESVATANDLAFIPYKDEHYDFITPDSRRTGPAVQAFMSLLNEPSTREHLRNLGFRQPG
jgi:putative molybdopterin biosynthesis protein